MFAAFKFVQWWNSGRAEPAEGLEPLREADRLVEVDPAAQAAEAVKAKRLTAFETFETLDVNLGALGVEPEQRQRLREEVLKLIAQPAKS